MNIDSELAFLLFLERIWASKPQYKLWCQKSCIEMSSLGIPSNASLAEEDKTRSRILLVPKTATARVIVSTSFDNP